MMPQIAIDDQVLHQLQQTGELRVESSAGMPLVVMTVGAREQLQRLAQDANRFDADDLLPLAHEALAEAWDAPGMDAYDDYDAHRTAKS